MPKVKNPVLSRKFGLIIVQGGFVIDGGWRWKTVCISADFLRSDVAPTAKRAYEHCL